MGERFLLLHGAGTGGWLWDQVSALLEADGHTVIAPTLAGVGERSAEGGPQTDVSTHVEQCSSLLSTDEMTVVVGFSYSGLVASRLAAEVPARVARVVLVDAFLPVPGRCFLDLMPPPMVARLRTAAAESGEGWKLPPLPLAAVGGIGAVEPDVDPAAVHEVLTRRGVHPLGTYLEQADESWVPPATVPVRYISCTDKAPDDPLRAIAGRVAENGGDVVELPTGHFCMLTMPRQLTALLASS